MTNSKPTQVSLNEFETTVSPSPQTTMFPQSTTAPKNKYGGALYKLGMAEIGFGALLLLCGISGAVITPNVIEQRHYRGKYWLCEDIGILRFTSQGIWCGLPLITAGVLGVEIRGKPSRCMYIANTTIANLTSIVLVIGLLISAGAAKYANTCSLQELLVIHAATAIICLLAMVVTIVHAIFTSGEVC